MALADALAVWRDGLKEEHKRYDRKLYDDAIKLFGVEGPEAYEQRKPGLMNFTGPPPQPWEPIEAAIQGNAAALGKKPLSSDPRVAKYFVVPQPAVPDFADSDKDNDTLLDLEEEHDPVASGGKREPVRRKPLARQEA